MWHVGWGGDASRDRGAMELPSKLAQLLGIPHGTGARASLQSTESAVGQDSHKKV